MQSSILWCSTTYSTKQEATRGRSVEPEADIRTARPATSLIGVTGLHVALPTRRHRVQVPNETLGGSFAGEAVGS